MSTKRLAPRTSLRTLALLAASLSAWTPPARAESATPGDGALAAAELPAPVLALLRSQTRAAAASGIPSFSRQTHLACSACHTAFLQLNAFGRSFKLNGYSLAGMGQITAAQTPEAPPLQLNETLPLSMMVETSLTHTARAEPGTQNDVAEFPQELSLFVGTAIADRMGTFLQFTYEAAEGTFGWDNADVRYARELSLGGRPTVLGLDLNNSPGVSDVWNSTPVWGFPFASSGAAPTPAASPLLAGALAQQVLGVGGYAYWNNLLYAELAAYRSAPQGFDRPSDASAESTIRGVSPYWRLALQHGGATHSEEIGTFGIHSRLYPVGVEGPTDRYTDVGADAQYQIATGPGNLTAHARYLHERQRLDASYAADAAANPTGRLDSWQVDGTLLLPPRVGLSLAYFSTTGRRDEGLYAPEPVFGSATGRPDSSGGIAELDYNLRQNVRLAAQYTLYRRFNGASDDYDGSGRDAGANDTLYFLLWLVF